MGAIKIDKRVPGVPSLHLHSDGHFHVDTCSPDDGFFAWLCHAFVDVVIGIWLFDTTGLPWI